MENIKPCTNPGAFRGVNFMTPRGCAAPCKALTDLATVAQYPDGSFSVDVYDADGTLATTVHLPSGARMADAFPATKGDR